MTLQEQIRSNRLRSGIVVAGFLLLLLVVGGWTLRRGYRRWRAGAPR